MCPDRENPKGGPHSQVKIVPATQISRTTSPWPPGKFIQSLGTKNSVGRPMVRLQINFLQDFTWFSFDFLGILVRELRVHAEGNQ